MKKLLDTNIIIQYTPDEILNAFEEGTEILITYDTIMELDGLKRSIGEKGARVRTAIRWLQELSTQRSLSDGIQTNDRIVSVFNSDQLDDSKVDHRLLIAARDNDMDLVTEDVHLRVLAGLHDIPIQRLGIDRKHSGLYTGIGKISITEEEVQSLYSKSGPSNFILESSKPNQYLIMTDPGGTKHFGICKVINGEKRIVDLPKHIEAWGVRPAKLKDKETDREQLATMHMLLDPDIHFVSMTGGSGCGKTYLSLACALEQTLGRKPIYDKILLMRSLIGLDEDIGFLPGSETEKILPWLGGAVDNLEQLLGEYVPKELNYKDFVKDQPQSSNKSSAVSGQSGRDRMMMLVEAQKIDIKAMNFVRGRSIRNQFIIIDDAQNLTSKQASNILTRAGEGSKVVFLGDFSPKQIDRAGFDTDGNGLLYVIGKMAGRSPLIGHIHLSNCNRSPLCELATYLL